MTNGREAAWAVPAFFGLGQMGAALAGQLADADELIVNDLSATAGAALEARGARFLTAAKELPNERRVLFICLPTSQHVEDLLFGEQDVVSRLAPGSVVVDMTTGDPDVSVQICRRLQGHSIGYADAPVSGGPQAANAGTIMIIVGASAPTYSFIEPVLRKISTNVVHIGDVGAGHTLKLVNNLLAAGNRLLAFEAAGIVARRGLNVARCIEVINKSSGRNHTTEITFPRHILTDDVAQNFALGLGHKDVKLARNLLPFELEKIALAPRILDILEGSLADLGAGADINEIIRLYERAADARIAGTA